MKTNERPMGIAWQKLDEQVAVFNRRYLEKFNFLNTSAVTQKQLELSNILAERSFSQQCAPQHAALTGRPGVQPPISSRYLVSIPLHRIYTLSPSTS